MFYESVQIPRYNLRMELISRFEQTALAQSHKPALIHFSRRDNDWKTITYGDVFDRTQRFMRGLESGPCSPGLSAALMTPPSADFFPFSLALLKFGIVPILVEPALGVKKIREIYRESKPDIFIGNPLTHALRILFGWGKSSVKHKLTINQISRFTHHAPSSTVHRPSSDLAAVIYTSGSTGLPKGAIYTHANLAAQLGLLKTTFGITEDEVDLPAFPLYALIDLLLGVTSVIPDITFPVPAKTNPEKVIHAIQKFNVTNMFASPVVLDLLSSFIFHPRATLLNTKLPSLKRVITAGAPATIDLQKRFRHLLEDHTSLFGVYGATESLPIANVESREVFALEEKTKNGAGICLGKPIAGATVRIIPVTDEPIQEWQDSLTVKKNVVGEITVQSEATTREYLNRAESNRLSKIYRHTCTGVRRKCCEEAELPDEAISGNVEIASGKAQERPRNDGMDIIHRTGDVGYFDDEGRLWYCGRKSHRVMTGNDVLFTEQIENIFNAHAFVYRTALVGVDGKPVLWVELKRGIKKGDTIESELIELARFHPQAAQIKTFFFMKKFPTDVRHNSKIIREQLTLIARSRISNRQP